MELSDIIIILTLKECFDSVYSAPSPIQYLDWCDEFLKSDYNIPYRPTALCVKSWAADKIYLDSMRQVLLKQKE